jgi:hypothetical protein
MDDVHPRLRRWLRIDWSLILLLAVLAFETYLVLAKIIER